MKNYFLLLCCLPLFLGSCSSDDTEMETLVTSTYVDQVKSIIDNNCISCHSNPPINGAPMGLTTAASVKEAILDRGLIERVEEGSMPEIGNLTTAEIQAIKDWKAGGYK